MTDVYTNDDVPVVGPPPPPSAINRQIERLRSVGSVAMPRHLTDTFNEAERVTVGQPTERPSPLTREERISVQNGAWVPIQNDWSERIIGLAWAEPPARPARSNSDPSMSRSDWNWLNDAQRWDLYYTTHQTLNDERVRQFAWRERAWMYAKVLRSTDSKYKSVIRELKSKLLQRYDEMIEHNTGCASGNREILESWMPYELAPTSSWSVECHACGQDTAEGATVATIYNEHRSMQEWLQEVHGDGDEIEARADWDS